MLGFSHAPELLILFVIAFMVFGPEKLPELGSWRRAWAARVPPHVQ